MCTYHLSGIGVNNLIIFHGFSSREYSRKNLILNTIYLHSDTYIHAYIHTNNIYTGNIFIYKNNIVYIQHIFIHMYSSFYIFTTNILVDKKHLHHIYNAFYKKTNLPCKNIFYMYTTQLSCLQNLWPCIYEPFNRYIHNQPSWI